MFNLSLWGELVESVALTITPFVRILSSVSFMKTTFADLLTEILTPKNLKFIRAASKFFANCLSLSPFEKSTAAVFSFRNVAEFASLAKVAMQVIPLIVNQGF